MPAEVRVYVLRRAVKWLEKAKVVSPDVQRAIATAELATALSDYELCPGLVSELIADGMNRLGQIPLEHCATCGRPVFTHEAVKIDDKSYCESCGNQRTSSCGK